MITKKDLKEFEENPPTNVAIFRSANFLFNRFNRFINIVKGRESTEKRANAEIYRILVRYLIEVRKKIDEAEQWLLKNMEEGENVYFVDQKYKEKIYKKNGELVLSDIEGTKEWRKAYKQIKENE